MRAEAVALMVLALSGCATPKVAPGFGVVWQEALQTCNLTQPDLTQRLAQWRLDDPELCVRSLQLGQQLQCLARELPARASQHASVTPTTALAFQSCLQPVAAGLVEGGIGRSSELILVMQQCTRPLELAWSAPLQAPPWAWPQALRWPLEARVAEPLPLVDLPPIAGPTWARCDDIRQLRSGVVKPLLPPAALSRPALPLPKLPLPKLPQRPISRLPTQAGTASSTAQSPPL
jgi:hypothetical protein